MKFLNFMKKKMILLFLVSVLAQSWLAPFSLAAPDTKVTINAANAPDATLQDVLGAVSGDNLIKYVNDLSQFSRCIYDSGHAQAIKYLVATLTDMGYQPQAQTLPALAVARGAQLQNIIVRKPGTNPQSRHVLGAHFDSSPSRLFPPLCDGFAPGANDNGTGTAALLEIARLLTKVQFRDDIELVFFDGEEFGYLGSDYYVQQAKADKASKPIDAVINIDMIGYPRDGGNSKTIYAIAQPGSSQALAKEGANLVGQYLPGVAYQVYTIGDLFPPARDPNRNSDQRSFWDGGVGSAIFLNEDARDILSGDPRWHTPGDILYQKDGSLRLDPNLFAQATRTAFLIAGVKAVPQLRRFFPNLDSRFEQTWAKADRPVAVGLESGQSAGRGWTWGAQPFQVVKEPYTEAPGGSRQVAYFDKARMELTDPNNGLVTNGLVVREMATGQLQLGNSRFESRAPSQVPIAGDPNESGQNPLAPVYASFKEVIERGGISRSSEPITATIDKQGKLGTDSSLGSYARNAFFVPETGHNIPDVFYNWFAGQGRIYDSATNAYINGTVFDWTTTVGLPITEAFWVTTRVAGTSQTVLVQLFERRVLTYTPANPATFKVEMGNVGRHYYTWRY